MGGKLRSGAGHDDAMFVSRARTRRGLAASSRRAAARLSLKQSAVLPTLWAQKGGCDVSGGGGTNVGDGIVMASGQRSAVAEGAEGNAYGRAVGHHVQVESVDPIAIAAQCGGQMILGVTSSGCRQDETEAAGDAGDESVDQQAGATKGN